MPHTLREKRVPQAALKSLAHDSNARDDETIFKKQFKKSTHRSARHRHTRHHREAHRHRSLRSRRRPGVGWVGLASDGTSCTTSSL